MIKVLFILLLSSTCVLLNASSPKFGLKTTNGEPLELLELKTKALVEGPYAEVQYIQTYKNPLDHVVETKYHFPRTDNSIFHKFEAIFRNQTLVGKVLEKQAAQRMYDWNVRRGNTVAYSDRNRVAPDIMNIKVGNIPPNETVEIVFSVIQPLETIINKFYELKLPVVLTERYSPAHIYHHDTPIIQTVDTKASLYKEWSIQVEVKSNSPFAILTNPSHLLKPELSEKSSGSSSKIYKAVWNVTVVPNKDFVIYFGPEKLEKPETILATSSQDPNNQVLLVNFLPDLNTIDTKIAQNFLEASSDGLLRLKKMAFDYDIEHAQAEFIFVIDRSGSMEGARIANLRKALAKYLNTIPKTSYFNIISFGSTFELYKHKSILNSPQALHEALEWVKTIEADMGGTEILDALRSATHYLPHIAEVPKIVMILTDGDVFNPDEVINHISANANKMRFCSVGIGSGASDYLVRNMAKAGKCRSEFVLDYEDIGEKALYMVQAAISQYITDVRFDINCFNDEKQKVYTEKAELDLLMKDQAFNKWVYLENISNLKSCQASLSYYNSLKGKRLTEEMEIQRYEIEEVTNFWHKVAYDAKIKELEQTVKRERNWNQGNIIKAKIIELSTKYQVLSDYTSFLAVLQENTVNPNEQPQQINIPNMKSADYSVNKTESEKAPKIEESPQKAEEDKGTSNYAGLDIDIEISPNVDDDTNIDVNADYPCSSCDVIVINMNTNVEVQNLLTVNADEFCEGCDNINPDFWIDDNVNLDVDLDMSIGADVLADVDVDIDDGYFMIDCANALEVQVMTNVEVEYAEFTGDCTETNVNVSVDAGVDDNADLTKEEESKEDENEVSKPNSKAQNLETIPAGWDCENVDNALIKECSGEGIQEDNNQEEKDTKEEGVHHKLEESSDLKLVNKTNHTINTSLTEPVSQKNDSSVQLAENSTQPVQTSAPSLALISDEKESESLQQNTNTTSKSLAGYANLRFTGVSLIIIILSVLFF